jgi:hypothetical protein
MVDGGERMQAFIESNDFGYGGEYGVFGSGAAEGLTTVQQYLTADSTFRNNLILLEGRSYAVTSTYALWRYPAEIFAMHFSFTPSDSYNADGTPFGQLLGTDGLVVGADNGAATPPPTPNPTPIPNQTPTPVPAPTPEPTPIPAPPPPTAVQIITATLPKAMRVNYYDQGLTATGGSGRYVWSVTAGSLPSGLLLDPATGRISGRPRLKGTWTFTARSADSQTPSLSATRSFSLAVK